LLVGNFPTPRLTFADCTAIPCVGPADYLRAFEADVHSPSLSLSGLTALPSQVTTAIVTNYPVGGKGLWYIVSNLPLQQMDEFLCLQILRHLWIWGRPPFTKMTSALSTAHPTKCARHITKSQLGEYVCCIPTIPKTASVRPWRTFMALYSGSGPYTKPFFKVLPSV
jgi:hypothetical protein